jgi:Protein of unknown function (DUF2911)
MGHLVIAATVLMAPSASAQIRASERGSVSQTVDGTMIAVDYGRAQARGRDSLFGKVVRKDEVWTPGANQATTFEASKDVTVGGKPLAAGKYSVWMVSDPASQWVLYFHKNAALFHTQHPKTAEMALAVPVEHSDGAEHVEVLTFDFPRVTKTGTELRLRWGRTIVPIEIGVTPTLVRAMTAEQTAPYVGSYGVVFYAQNGKPSPERKLAILNAKGVLRGIMDGPGDGGMQFVPTDTPHRFTPAFTKGDEITDVEAATQMDFTIENGRATGFVVWFQGKPWMEGKRKE